MTEAKKIISMIVGIPVAIILLSTTLYFLVDKNLINLGTVNHGNLIQPPLQIANLNAQGEAPDPSKENKWQFLVIANGSCDNDCETMLYISRQSHIALGKKLIHVERSYIEISDENTASVLPEKYSEVKTSTTSMKKIKKLFVKSDIDPLEKNQFFVVDRQGWIMMRYHFEDTTEENLNNWGKKIVKDMKRLIK